MSGRRKQLDELFILSSRWDDAQREASRVSRWWNSPHRL